MTMRYLLLVLLALAGAASANRCSLNGTEAICFKLPNNHLIRAIRDLPSNVTSLAVVETIFPYHALWAGHLDHLYNLEYFNVTHCYLDYISSGSLNNLTSLKGVAFVENQLKQRQLQNLLISLRNARVKKLEYLYFASNIFYNNAALLEMENASLIAFQGLEINILNLMNNQIASSVNGWLGHLFHLRRVKCICVSYNLLKTTSMNISDFMHNIHALTSLTMIDSSYQHKLSSGTFSDRIPQYSQELAEQCRVAIDQSVSLQPLPSNNASTSSVQYPQNLSVVISRQKYSKGKPISVTDYFAPSNIKYVDLSGFPALNFNITAPIVGFEKLQELHLVNVTNSSNYLSFSNETFKYMQKLRKIDLSFNRIDAESRKHSNVFNWSPVFQTLILRGTQDPPLTILDLGSKSGSAFLTVPRAQSLILTDNSELTEFPTSTFFHLNKNLTLLDIQNHGITDPTGFIESNRYIPPIQMRIKGSGAFQCNCQYGSRFPGWLRQRKQSVLDAENIKCQTQDNGLLLALGAFVKCKTFELTIWEISLITLGVLFLVALCFLLYAIRWRMLVAFIRMRVRKTKNGIFSNKTKRVMLVQAQDDAGKMQGVTLLLAKYAIPVFCPYGGLITRLSKKALPVFSQSEAVLGMDLGHCFVSGIDSAKVIVFLCSDTALKDENFIFACNVAKIIIKQKPEVQILFVQKSDDIMSTHDNVYRASCCFGNNGEDAQAALTYSIIQDIRRLRQRAPYLFIEDRSTPGSETSYEEIVKKIKELLELDSFVPARSIKSSFWRICSRRH